MGLEYAMAPLELEGVGMAILEERLSTASKYHELDDPQYTE